MIEVKIKVSDEETNLTEKFLIYEPFSISTDDPILKDLVDQTLAKLKSPLQDGDIVIKIKYYW